MTERREVLLLNMYYYFLSLGIKLMQELIDRTEDETELQLLAQCVSLHRKEIGFTKKDYEKLDMF